MAETPKQSSASQTPKSYEQQPVEQQYFAQPQAAPVQYVIAQQSLKGIRGWLLFFTVISGLAALTYVAMFVNTVAGFTADKTADVIFLPLIIAAAVGSVVLVALEKKLARYAFIALYAVAYLYGIVSSSLNGAEAAALITSLLIGGLWVLFISLYFLTSKRVKETLVK